MTGSCPQEREASDLNADGLGPWSNVPRNDSAPFIHKFQTSQQKYVYDVNTRRIIRVSSVVWQVIDHYGLLPEEAIIENCSSTYSRQELSSALAQIAVARKKQGLFLSFRPRSVLPAKRDMVAERLDRKREQLILDVTEDCNFRCSYCVYGGGYEHQRRHSSRTMDWDVAGPAIDDFMDHSRLSESRVISFYGGEPLLNLHLSLRSVAYL